MNKDDPQQRMDIYLQKNEEMIKMPVDDNSQELKENVHMWNKHATSTSSKHNDRKILEDEIGFSSSDDLPLSAFLKKPTSTSMDRLKVDISMDSSNDDFSTSSAYNPRRIYNGCGYNCDQC